VSVALYMDVHVPRPITRGLRKRGVDVLTVQVLAKAGLPADFVNRVQYLPMG
jgi:hypothetical protein